jgi:hypothetical protein
MNEKYVISLEWSKKLDEVGFKKESEFLWYKCSLSSMGHKTHWTLNPGSTECILEETPAYLAGELLEELPEWWKDGGKGVLVFRNYGIYFVQLRKDGFNKPIVDFNDDILPNALAAMICYLKQEKII